MKSLMLSDSVAQKPIIPVSDGTNAWKNAPPWSLLGWLAISPNPWARPTAHHSSAPVITST